MPDSVDFEGVRSDVHEGPMPTPVPLASTSRDLYHSLNPTPGFRLSVTSLPRHPGKMRTSVVSPTSAHGLVERSSTKRSLLHAYVCDCLDYERGHSGELRRAHAHEELMLTPVHVASPTHDLHHSISPTLTSRLSVTSLRRHPGEMRTSVASPTSEARTEVCYIYACVII